MNSSSSSSTLRTSSSTLPSAPTTPRTISPRERDQHAVRRVGARLGERAAQPRDLADDRPRAVRRAGRGERGGEGERRRVRVRVRGVAASRYESGPCSGAGFAADGRTSGSSGDVKSSSGGVAAQSRARRAHSATLERGM